MFGNKGSKESYRSGGTRGGRDQFKWEDVKNDKDRDHYLGASVHATKGRWQEGRDLLWYTKGKGSQDAVLEAEKQRQREEDEDRINAQLGLPPIKRVRREEPATESHQLDEGELKSLLNRSGGQGDDPEGQEERIKGIGSSKKDDKKAKKEAKEAKKREKKEKKEMKKEKKREKKEKKDSKKDKKRRRQDSSSSSSDSENENEEDSDREQETARASVRVRAEECEEEPGGGSSSTSQTTNEIETRESSESRELKIDGNDGNARVPAQEKAESPLLPQGHSQSVQSAQSRVQEAEAEARGDSDATGDYSDYPDTD